MSKGPPAPGDGDFIPFNRPLLLGTEVGFIEDAARRGWLAAGGDYCRRCEAWLERRTGSTKAFLTGSCTSALEAAALVAGVAPGDEVVMPSFTFATTASAFALRGATPVFVDIDPRTLNLDPERAEAAITPRTRAIAAVHYAGVGAEMDAICAIADRHDLLVVEDAAQGILASYRDRPLGAIGSLGAVSFHETKNVTCGEGGALLVNDPELVGRAEVICEKGTDRRRFERGEVDRYRWVALGSSFGAGEVTAAFLWAQLEAAERVTARRHEIWSRYHEAFEVLERAGLVRRPIVPASCDHNAHLYYLLLRDPSSRAPFMEHLRGRGILSVFHYVPLHDSPAGTRFGRAAGSLEVTESVAPRLVRLPLWVGLDDEAIDRVIDASFEALSAGTARTGRRSRRSPAPRRRP